MSEKKYLAEAFEALNILNEEVFDVTDKGVAELQKFVDEDEKTPDIENVIDPLATTEEELKDSYLGKAILDCIICQSKIYKDPAEVVISEDGTLANVGEVCPYCQSSDGFKVIGQVAEFCPECDKHEDEVKVETEDEVKVDVEEKPEEETEEMNEDLNRVELETDTQKIKIETEPKDECEECSEEKEEIIAPVSEETEEEFKSEEVEEEPEYQDIDIDEFDEEDFDELGEKYLRRVYENVKSYKTIKGSTKGNKIQLEGIITFKSGKKGKTNFVFEAKSITKTGKLKFLGENKQFARGKQAFVLTGRANNGKLLAESLTYNYRARDAKNGAPKRLYGTVKKA